MSVSRAEARLPGRAWACALLFFAWSAGAYAEESARVYDANCALCHQKGGVGLAGQFPRLAGRVGQMAATDAGRRYLIEVALFGMAGKIEVDGSVIVGVMPPFALLSDEDVATTLNYLIALDGADNKGERGKRPTISAADVGKVRAGPVLAPGQVHSNRAGVTAKRGK